MYRKIISIAAAMLILFGTLAFGGISRVEAIEPGMYYVPGNPTCATLNADPFFDNIVSDFGFKLNEAPLGTFPLDKSNGGSLEGGAPSDSFNSVSILDVYSVTLGQVFDWAATLGIDAVIVKGGPNSEAYVYVPESYGDIGLHAPTNPTNNTYYGISHIEFCYDYELFATKTAEAKVYKTIDWTITKDVTPASASKFIGEDATFDYTVSVNKEVIFGPWVVEGTITVKNPTPWPVEFEVMDEVNGVPATVDCGEVTTLTANDGLAGGTDEVVCTYSISSPTEIANGSNVATVTSYTEGVGGYVTEAVPFAFGDPILSAGSEPESITVTDSNGESWSTSVSATWIYSETQTCSTETALYAAFGFYSTDYNNTAKINETIGDSDSEKVTLTCYAPVVSKDADTEWKKKYDWTITKSVDPAKHVGFVGDEFTSDYDVVVDQTITDYGYKAFGKIYVTNPVGSPGSITVDVSDAVDGKVATVDCDGLGGTSLTVLTGETKSCGYTVDLADTTQLINTATVKFNTFDFLAKADVIYGDPVIEGYPTINVTDSVQGPLGSASGDYTFEYSDTFTCSSNPLDYKDGFDSDKYPNTATINETIQFDDAEVTVDCYAPVVTKTADASYDERHTWEITKSVDPTSQSGYPGDLLDWTWTVTVTEDYVEENFAVSGSIYVANPVGSPGDMTVSLVDQLIDGTVATVDCGGGATSVTVAPGATGTCTYTASPSGRTADLNTATGTFKSVDFVATALVSFTKNIVNGSAKLTDSEIGLNETLTAGLGPWTRTGIDSHTCSTTKEAYGVDGTYSKTIDNTATVDGSEQEPVSSSASTTYLCEAGFMDLLKLTNGVEVYDDVWTFNLYKGDFDGTLIATDQTPPALLDFGAPALRPDTTYTVCEMEVPAGYSSFWMLGEEIIQPYNPNQSDDPPEDLGNRCYDFTPTTGTTLKFTVDNQYPGGDPRTPGYWKNWNTCTGGGQQYTAIANGGWEEGFWLLDDVLAKGITWDDILDDGVIFEITECEDAVNILDKRTLSGKKVASDPFHNLATHLLAAQLNFGAGACTTPEVLAKALEAETLLDKVNFIGSGYVKPDKKSTDVALANSLATYLDNYNNGMYCGSLMP
jgi:hypothetical protein